MGKREEEYGTLCGEGVSRRERDAERKKETRTREKMRAKRRESQANQRTEGEGRKICERVSVKRET